MAIRNHDAFVIEDFNGLWDRGDADNVPPDHAIDCNNVELGNGNDVATRPALNTLIARSNVRRIYQYLMQTGDSLLILDTNGDFWHHVFGPEITYGPILHVDEATDFGFVAIAGRAYITPFKTFTDDSGVDYQAGVPGEFVYVYKGDGSAARPAAGNPPTSGTLTAEQKYFIAFNSANDGKVAKGIHVFAISINGGELTPAVFPVVNAPGGKQVQLTNLPMDPSYTSRIIYSTRAIDPLNYVADQSTYTYYQVVDITDPDLENILVNFSDAELTVAFSGTGVPPTNDSLKAENTATLGYSDAGLHLFAVVYETDTGYLTALGPEIFASLTTVDIKTAIKLTNIPVSPDSFVIARHIVATKVIPDYNGDQTGYQFFFVPGARIGDNTTTELTFSFYDADLLEDASHLIENFSAIPAVVGLTTYHGRMIAYTTTLDISLIGVSAPGEPEAINQVDGLLIVPLDGNPVTNAQEFRDVLYVFKKTRTVAFNDNGDVPSSWPFIIIDQGIGAPVHGISTVLDSGGVNLDYLLIADYSGIMMFNGAYARPELTWKIQDLWFNLNRNQFDRIQIQNDSLSQILYITLPDRTMLVGYYNNGLDPKSIRWTPWSFHVDATTIALVETNKLIVGAENTIIE